MPGADSALVAAAINFPQALRKGFAGGTCTSSADQLVPGRMGCCVMLFKASKLFELQCVPVVTTVYHRPLSAPCLALQRDGILL